MYAISELVAQICISIRTLHVYRTCIPDWFCLVAFNLNL